MDDDGFYKAYHMTTKQSGLIPSNFVELHQLPPLAAAAVAPPITSVSIRNEQDLKKTSKNDKEKEPKEKGKVSGLAKFFSKKWFLICSFFFDFDF